LRQALREAHKVRRGGLRSPWGRGTVGVGRQMPDISKAAKVGVLTIAMVVALYFAYSFISREAGTSDGYSVYAYLPDVTGVAPRSRVMISGVQVGVVSKISLDKGRARVDVKMKPEFPLYDDAAIGRKATSLIGEYYVVLTPGTEGKERIPDGGRIKHLIEEASIDSIQGQIRDILVDVKGVTQSLRETVGSDKGQERIEAILKNLAELTEQLNNTVRENRDTLRSTLNNVNAITAESRPEVAVILKNLRAVTNDIAQLTGRGRSRRGNRRPAHQG
jgi:phospholipid/cholesterol/gamma-HCH transport system substrate-binding protein